MIRCNDVVHLHMNGYCRLRDVRWVVKQRHTSNHHAVFISLLFSLQRTSKRVGRTSSLNPNLRVGHGRGGNDLGLVFTQLIGTWLKNGKLKPYPCLLSLSLIHQDCGFRPLRLEGSIIQFDKVDKPIRSIGSLHTYTHIVTCWSTALFTAAIIFPGMLKNGLWLDSKVSTVRPTPASSTAFICLSCQCGNST